MKIGSGKNNKFLYFLKNGLRWSVPRPLLRRQLAGLLEGWENRPDWEYIRTRVNYYCKPPGNPVLTDPCRVGDFTLKGNGSAYFFDSYEYLRYFPADLYWKYIFGDVVHIPDEPSIVKSRPIEGDNAHSVLLNLDKNRHFVFLNDKTDFRSKEDRAIFRGEIEGKPHRVRFMEQFYGHPLCEAANVRRCPEIPDEWYREKISFYDHLLYKFIIALEGNDVASNLKWVMSSRSVAVMPRPVYETWFIEGTLIPEYHYIEIRKDYADLPEKLRYYIDHPEKAEAIARHANEYVDQFLNPRREKLISLLVLQKYFEQTGQL